MIIDPYFFSHCYSEEEHVMMSLRTWINVVEGKMLGIDRSVASNVTLKTHLEKIFMQWEYNFIRLRCISIKKTSERAQCPLKRQSKITVIIGIVSVCYVYLRSVYTSFAMRALIWLEIVGVRQYLPPKHKMVDGSSCFASLFWIVLEHFCYGQNCIK